MQGSGRGYGLGDRDGRGRRVGGRGLGRGEGRGRMGGDALMTGGTCYCPKCDYEVPHQSGSPCYKMKCITCESSMVRK